MHPTHTMDPSSDTRRELIRPNVGSAVPGRLLAELLATALALAAWLSQLPYFFWSMWRVPMLVGALLTGGAAVLSVWSRRGEGIERRDIIACLGLAVFATYISVQKTVDGGHSMWIFIIPTLVALCVARPAEKALALRRFEALFLVSLVPGVIYLTLMILGVPLTFSVVPPQNAGFAAAGVRMLELPGAVFFEGNSQSLPWGGVVSRLCGMFDEPGMVGTIAALLLAARGYRIKGIREVALYIVGVLSFSLAFIVLVLMGVTVRLLVRRDWRAALCGVPVVLSGMFVVGAIELPRSEIAAIQVEVTEASQRNEEAAGPEGSRAPTDSVADDRAGGEAQVAPATEPMRVEGARVRQIEQINNRSQPGMDRLFERYLESDWTTRVFGIASNASGVYGGPSSIWTRVLTNHGILGFLLLCGPLVAYGWTGWLRASDRFVMALFLASYGLSFYQRPLIWVPYSLVVFFGAVAALDSGRERRTTVESWPDLPAEATRR